MQGFATPGSDGHKVHSGGFPLWRCCTGTTRLHWTMTWRTDTKFIREVFHCEETGVSQHFLSWTSTFVTIFIYFIATTSSADNDDVRNNGFTGMSIEVTSHSWNTDLLDTATSFPNRLADISDLSENQQCILVFTTSVLHFVFGNLDGRGI